MEFDKETLQPLYRLTIGEAGESYALQIAEKLGIPAEVIRRSHQLVVQQREQQSPGMAAGRGQGIRAHAKHEPLRNSGEDKPARAEDEENLPKDNKNLTSGFEIGDAVYVSPLNRTGIVYAKQDSMGIVGVMVQKEKMRINHKRLKPYLSKDELYPEDYDFDIIFESKEDRKKRKLMRKRHVEGLSIIHTDEEG
ncbi:Endonuclease MutS2 [compost metagenome]